MFIYCIKLVYYLWTSSCTSGKTCKHTQTDVLTENRICMWEWSKHTDNVEPKES